MAEKTKAPAVRFEDFTDAWEQRKLGGFCGITTGKLDANAMVTDGMYDFYTSGIQKYRIDTAAFEGPAITIAGNGATVGYMHLADGKFNAYQRTYVLSSFQAERQYLFYAIGNELPSKIAAEARTGNIPYIVMDMLTELDILVPDKREQRKIGTFFTNLDNLITLHQRKLLKLQNIKKAMLGKMFPRDGSNVPEVRFAGLTDAWEQHKASELFVATADKGYPELPVLSATQDRGMIKRDDSNINIFHDKKNEEGYKRVMPGQFVIHLRSFQGGFAHSAIEGITSPAYTVFGFKEQENHNDIFWKYIFASKEFIRRLETVTYGIRDGRSISYDEFLTMSFLYPNAHEQKHIAGYLSTLDNLITLHQRKLEKLQNMKKACLEKMFA